MDRSSPGVDEFLQEDFAVDSICFFSEHRAEDHRHAVVRGFDVNRFFVPVMNRAHFAAFAYTLGCGFGGVAFSLLLQGRELVEGLFEGRGHGVAL